MTELATEDLLTEALEDVNILRQRLGAPPLSSMPKGRRNDPACCPAARAFRGLFSICVLEGSNAYFGNDNEVVAAAWKTGLDTDEDGTAYGVIVPERLSDFIFAFDKGGYPSLVLSDEEWNGSPED